MEARPGTMEARPMAVKARSGAMNAFECFLLSHGGSPCSAGGLP
jgi:hypothetical protein